MHELGQMLEQVEKELRRITQHDVDDPELQATIFWIEWTQNSTMGSEYDREVLGWAIRVMEDRVELSCDHEVGICNCNIILLHEDAQEWYEGKCVLSKHGWTVHEVGGRMVGECMV